MKYWIILVGCVAAMTPLSLVSNHGIQWANVSLSTASASELKADAFLGVDQLMRDVDRYRGIILVEGIVSTVSPEAEMLALIDSKEYAKCGVVTCSTLSLPVHWKGSMPAVSKSVRIKGEVKEQEGKLVLEARELESATPRKGGAQ
jgi:hypothetical protein